VSSLRSTAYEQSLRVIYKASRVITDLDGRLTPRLPNQPSFTCPICRFHGPFVADWSLMGRRAHASCPSCGSQERHRIQKLVMDRLAEQCDFSTMSMLHLAPEEFMRPIFREQFCEYVMADFDMPGMDMIVDLTDTDLPDGRFDVIHASHVFEHIADDRAAAQTVARLLRPGGFAVLPVPIVCSRTVEFPRMVDTEYGHVRAPGPDYFDRFEDLFEIERFTSEDVDQDAQVWVYEDRSNYPSRFAPYRTPSPGRRHLDLVPVLRPRR